MRCTSGVLPTDVSYDDSVGLCPLLAERDKPVILWDTVVLAQCVSDTDPLRLRGKMQGQCLCVSLYIDICQIYMCMGIWICIYIVDVYTHTHAQKHINLKQNSSGP